MSAVAVRELVDEPVDELVVVLDDPVSSVSSFEFIFELVGELVDELVGVVDDPAAPFSSFGFTSFVLCDSDGV